MTLANILFIAFIIGFILGFICCLFLIYLIRREMEQVAEGERVAIKIAKSTEARNEALEQK